jgi:hypothetical protein
MEDEPVSYQVTGTEIVIGIVCVVVVAFAALLAGAWMGFGRGFEEGQCDTEFGREQVAARKEARRRELLQLPARDVDDETVVMEQLGNSLGYPMRVLIPARDEDQAYRDTAETAAARGSWDDGLDQFLADLHAGNDAFLANLLDGDQ